MKRMWIALVLVGWLALLTAACAGPSAPDQPEGETAQIAYAEAHPTYTPFPRPTPRIPNRVYYTKRCWPACHLDPNYVHESTQIFTDQFEEGLGPGWGWRNEDPAHWSLKEEGGLRIVAQPADLNRLEDAPNLLVRGAPESHFDAIVEVSFRPTAEGQMAVLFIQTQGGEGIHLARGYCEDGPECVGDGVYFGATLPECAPASLPFGGETATLMLRRAGNLYIGYVLSGEEWVEVGECYALTAPIHVGLTAVTSSDVEGTPRAPVDFETFTLVERH